MKIGLDFDNTIISYDAVFHAAACERGFDLSGVAVDKTAVRDYLRAQGQEEIWIELQGYVYGKKMLEAEPFPGVLEFFAAARRSAIPLCIISHKTRHPFRGPAYDLHEASRHWLNHLGLCDPAGFGVPAFLELTKEAKAARIAAEGCDCFVDDLPEFLRLPSFPASTRGILFSPTGTPEQTWDGPVSRSWAELRQQLLETP